MTSPKRALVLREGVGGFALALALTLVSLAVPASSPLVPAAGAQTTYYDDAGVGDSPTDGFGFNVHTSSQVPDGTAFFVTVSPKAGSHEGCDANPDSAELTAKTYRIQAQSNSRVTTRFTASGQHAVRRPVGADSDCEYDVSFAPHEEGLNGRYVLDTSSSTAALRHYEVTPAMRLAGSRWVRGSHRNNQILIQIRFPPGLDIAADEQPRFDLPVVRTPDTPSGCINIGTLRFDLSRRDHAGAHLVSVPIDPAWWGPGGVGVCRYRVEYPPLVLVPGGDPFVLDPDDDDIRTIVHENATRARRRYIRDPLFDMKVEVAAPQTVSKTTSFAVEIAAASGAPAECALARRTETVTIPARSDSASITLTDLVRAPQGVSTPCTYEVTFPESETERPQRYAHDSSVAARTLQVVHTAPEAQARYAFVSEFQPDVGFHLTSLPPAATRGDTFTVAYSHAADSPAGCTQAAVSSESWSVSQAGIAQPPASRVMLASAATGSSEFCRYEMTWPDIAGLVKPTGDPPVFTVESDPVWGTYALDVSGAAAGSWTHEMEITLPFRDANGDGVNDYDPQFSFGVNPHESEVAQGPTCPRATVAPRLSAERGARVIDDAGLAGLAEGCGLATDFPATIASGVAGITLEASLDDPDAQPPVNHDSHEEFTAGDGNHIAKVEYQDGRGVGQHGIEFRIPGRLPFEALDQEVTVYFEPKRGDCRGHPDDYRETWQIDSSGSISRQGDRALLMSYPPEGSFDDADTYCEYDVIWPEIPGLIKPTNPSFKFTRASMEIVEGSSRGSYSGPTYYPDNLARAIQLHTTNGVPAGTPFLVTISPQAGSVPGCDANPDGPETAKTYQMLSNNPWIAKVFNITHSGRHLVKRPAGASVDCAYDVMFAPDEEGPTDSYILDSSYGDRRTVLGNIPRTLYSIFSYDKRGVARERYTVNPNPSTFFDAMVEVSVSHNVTANTTFGVAVVPTTGSPDGCSEHPDLSVTVMAGSNAASLPVTQLLHQSSGATQTCSYVVTFDPNEDGGTAYQFDPRYDAPVTEISGATGAAMVARQRYTADTFFDGEVTVSTAQNVTADTAFEVGVAPASDAPMGCSDAVPDVSVTLTAGTTSATATVPTLVRRTAGAMSDCEYVADFPEHESGYAARYVKDAAFTTASTAIAPPPTSSAAQVRYTLNPTPSPTFDATVEVLLTEVVSVDTTFTASVVPAATAHEACVGEPSLTVTVPAESQSATLTVSSLLDLPAGETNPCVYQVTFAPDVIGADAHWFPDTSYTAVTTLTQDAAAASQRYEPRVWLYPTTGPNAARVLVWITDDVPDTVSFEATITAASRPTACLIYATNQVAAITLTFDAPASPNAPAAATLASDQQLVRRPQGATTDCTYTVTFDADEVGPTANYVLDATFANIDTFITFTSRDAQHRYTRAATSEHWTMQMLIDIPFRDDDGDGANDYDPQFSIDVSPGANSDSAGGACPTTTLMPRLRSQTEADTVATARLVGLAPGCEPTLEFPADIASGSSDIMLTLATTPAAQEAPTAASPRATATYVDGRTSFQPEVTINLPDPVPTEAVGAQFVVTFIPTTTSPTGCAPPANPDGESWSVTATGAARDAGRRATLVGVPAGTTEACAYRITWPSIAGLVTPSTSTLTFAPDDVAGSTTLAVAYRARSERVPFTPMPSVSLPVVDYDGDGAHDYAGARLVVTYAPKSGGHRGCTQGETEAIYEVQAALVNGATAVEMAGAAPSLTDAPMDSSHACAYDVAFSSTAATVGAPDVALFALVAAASDDVDVSAAANDARATYGTASQAHEVAFTADVGAAAAGATETFTVTVSVVAPADADSAFDGCTGVMRDAGTGAVSASSFDVVLTVDAAGTARGSADVVEWPAGHDAATDRCGYEVVWPFTEDGATTVYRRTDEATTLLDAAVFAQASPTMSNAYTADDITFDATLRLVTTPEVPAGTTFSVAIAPASGAPSGCSMPQPVAIAAASPHADGTSDVNATQAVTGLVDIPGGSIERCTYDVAWMPNTAGEVHFVEDEGYAQRSTTLSASTEAATTAAARMHPDPNQPLPDEPLDNEPPDDDPPGDDPPDDEPSDGEPPDDDPPDDEPPDNEPPDGTMNPSNTNPSTGGTSAAGNQPTVNPVTPPRAPTGGGTSRRTSGGGSRGGSSDGGASGGVSSGAGSTGPWLVAATSRVPVAVSLAMPERDFAVGTAIEIMLNVPGTCGEDVAAFGGLPAEVGLVYALTAQAGATVDVFAADALLLAGYAQRGNQTRGCELRVTLISAPDGCRLQSADVDASTDDVGRSYVDVTGSADLSSFTLNPTLSCSSPDAQPST